MEMSLSNDVLPIASWHPNPYDARDRRDMIYVHPLQDETIGEYLDRVGWDAPIDTYSKAYLDGKFVPKERWLDTVFLPGQRLSVHAAHAGGDSDFGRIIALIVLVAAIAMGQTWLVSQFGTFGAAVASAGLMIGGQMLINTLFPINTRDKISGAAQDPTYNLNGGSNSARPYEPLPIIVGRHRVYPDIDEKPFSYFENNDQYLVQSFNFGLGTLVVEDQRIGESTLDSLGVSSFEVYKSTMTNVYTEPGSDLKFSTGWVTRSSPADTVEIALDIGGVLVEYDKKGNEKNLTATFAIEISPYGANSWTPITTLEDVQIGLTPDYWEMVWYADPDGPPPPGEGWFLSWESDPG